MPVTLYEGDSLAILPTLPENSIHAVVCDPPYHLTQLSRGGSPRVNDTSTPFGRTKLGDRGFMGLVWDGGDIALRPETWAAMLRVLKPGAFLVSFGGTRTYHRLAVAIEDAGFELKETLMWIHSSGFPKVGYIRDQDGDHVREGWGGSLKPAYEPIILARRPLDGNTADNMRKHGTGALNVDACRVAAQGRPLRVGDYKKTADNVYEGRQDGSLMGGSKAVGQTDLGRWPSNVIHDGSDELLDIFDSFGDKKSGVPGVRRKEHETHSMAGRLERTGDIEVGYADSGSVARFFQGCPFETDEALRLHYCSKASKADRHGSKHPTVKPISLMRYLCKLITPPGGVVVDPFAGSGATGQAAVDEGFDAILIEREPQYANDIRRRLALFMEHDIK